MISAWRCNQCNQCDNATDWNVNNSNVTDSNVTSCWSFDVNSCFLDFSFETKTFRNVETLPNAHLSVAYGKEPERLGGPGAGQSGPQEGGRRESHGEDAAVDDGIQDHGEVAEQFRVAEEDLEHGVHELQQQGHLLAETRLLQHRVRRGFVGRLGGRGRSRWTGRMISIADFIIDNLFYNIIFL